MGQHKFNPKAEYFQNQPAIDWDKVPRQRCPTCHSKYFIQMTELGVLSPIQSPSGQSQIYPIPILICANCKQAIIAEDITAYNMTTRKDQTDDKPIDEPLIVSPTSLEKDN